MSVICRNDLSCAYENRIRGKLRGSANPGLAFERYLPSDGEAGGGHDTKEKAKAAQIAFLDGVCGDSQGPDSLYGKAYIRWRGHLDATATALPEPASEGEAAHELCPHLGRAELACTDRLLIGMGNKMGMEVGLTFSRTYGMPVIPGSALKGLCRRYYLKHLEGANDSHDAKGKSVPEATFHTLFGTTGAGGLVTFYDAWYVPGSAPGGPLRRDVITVHHRKYYGEKGGTPPTDFDDPTPVAFLSATGRFLFAVKGPTEAWTQFAMDLLKMALADYGVGGKTSSGYGRFGSATGATPGGGPVNQQGQLGRQAQTLLNQMTGWRTPNSQGAQQMLAGWRRLNDESDKRTFGRQLQQWLSPDFAGKDRGGVATFIRELNEYLEGPAQ